MDIVAHGLWVAVGFASVTRHRRIPGKTAAMAIALAALPDLAHLLPLVPMLWEPDGMRLLSAYVVALPGFEPELRPWVAVLVHHLHCVMHSAVVAALVTAAVWIVLGRFWWPLVGWWSHIVIDVFTHSADFYPVPVLYPLSNWAFDGVAWNDPRFIAVNYVALIAAATWLVATRRS